ncbi:chitobiase/beta-hexosaminidase C-terminal domain-containing protein [Leptospira kanakyensis]|uniref:chitobiase/beta-hexosaminidase C-terminal domain-containing protein n=1 Tax=Leptospira kanakyensis TaxID=2484968 RepID=UPI00223E5355|nr:chitobiase/beta-hexosaminidase C-terminal domain-containing protein [Leptospira kanakyensis]MCW7471561.1 chitobiase/beta-hexosaminidase C-terminal domain-containing protein [Leptospira kanakyensis]
MRNSNQYFHYLSLILIFSFQFCILLPNNGSNPNAIMALLLGLGGRSSTPVNMDPGTVVDLSGNGSFEGTLVDSDGNGISDGIALTGIGVPNLILIDTNADSIPDAVDTNGDGVADYYINPTPPAFLTTGPGGSGSPVVAIVDSSGNLIGFDTDGDGTANDTLVAQILGDTAPPTITSSLSSGTYSTSQTTTLTCTDNFAPGNIIYTLDGSTPNFQTKVGTILSPPSKTVSLSFEGSRTLTAFCRDLNGNLSSTIQINYTVDSSVPALTLVSQTSLAVSSSGTGIQSSTATWQTNRSGSYAIYEGSSCSGTNITTGSASANQNITFVRSYTNFSGEGTKSYRICVTGSNGLVGFVSFSLQRDDTAPVVSTSPSAGNYSSATSVTASCTDVGGSGCEKIAYTTQAGSAPSNPGIQGPTGNITNGVLYSSAIDMSDASVTYTKFVARDNAGNLSSIHSQTFTVDTQVATITVNSFTSAINGSSNVNLNWQSSKVGTYQIRIGGSSCSTGTELTNGSGNSNVSGSALVATDISSTITNTHFSEGENTIRICVSNLIGSFGFTTRTTNKDTIAPNVSITSPSGSGPFPSGTQIQLSCSDTGGTGCDKIIYTLNGTDPTFDSNGAVTNGSIYSSAFALSNGNIQVKYRAIDLAKNNSSVITQNIYVGPPVISSVGVGTAQLTVNFSTVTGATGYKVYYSSSSGVTNSNSSVSGTSSPIVLTGLNNDTTYYIRIALTASYGESDLGSETYQTPSNLPLVESCILQWPSTLTLTRNTTANISNAIYVQFYHTNITNIFPQVADSRVQLQVGYGPSNSNPMTEPQNWTFFSASYNSSCLSCGNNHEYYSLITAPSNPGTYKYVGRLKITGVAREIYCDLDGYGGYSGLTFSTSQLGTLTVQ